MIYNYRITDLRNSLSSQRFQRFFILVSLICPFHCIRPDKRGAKIEKRCDWSNTLLHWVLFASIFVVPFKSNYHSDQLLHKILGKLSCLHLSCLSLSSLIITLTNSYKRVLENSLVCISLIRPVVYLLLWPIAFWLIFILTNYRSDTSSWKTLLFAYIFLSLSSLIITLTNCHTRFLETILFASLLCVPFKSY